MQKFQDVSLQRRERGVEVLDDHAVTHEMVALGVGGDLQDPRGTGRGAVTRLGVERQALTATGLARAADLSLEQGFGELGEEVTEQQGLDPVGLFEVDRGDELGALQHMVTTFSHSGSIVSSSTRSHLARVGFVGDHLLSSALPQLVVGDGRSRFHEAANEAVEDEPAITRVSTVEAEDELVDSFELAGECAGQMRRPVWRR